MPRGQNAGERRGIGTDRSDENANVGIGHMLAQGDPGEKPVAVTGFGWPLNGWLKPVRVTVAAALLTVSGTDFWAVV